jgi:hypothetical protein
MAPRTQLGRTLRELREAARLERGEAAARLACSDARIERVESGARVAIDEVRSLLDLYRVDCRERREAVLELARDAHRADGAPPGVVVPPLDSYNGLAAHASSLRQYQSLCLDGVIMTDDYARATLRARTPHATVAEIDRLVAAHRTRREEFLRRARAGGAGGLWVIVKEAALRQRFTDRETTLDQVRHLIALVDEPGVTLQILPSSSSAQAQGWGGFSLLEFADGACPDLALVETPRGRLVFQNTAELEGYRLAFERLCLDALGFRSTRESLRRMIGAL